MGLWRFIIHAKVIEVWVVEVHEGVLKGPHLHWALLKQFLIQNYTCKMNKELKFAEYNLIHAQRS